MTDPSAFVHATAAVNRLATVGPKAYIWHWTHIREFALLGEQVSVGQSCYIDHHVTIGAGTRIQNHVSVYYGVKLGINVFVGPGVRFTNDRHPRAGEYSKWNPEKPEPTLVEEGASIGAGAVILPVHIGRYALVGAGSVVTHPVEDHQVVRGNPARVVGYTCWCGMSVHTAQTLAQCPHCWFDFASEGAAFEWRLVQPLSEPWRP